MTTNRQKVYQSLKDDLMNGVFKSGEIIADRPLADKYQVSRTPVREALRQLSAEGFVEVVPNVGTRVAMIAKEQVVPSYHLMARIEQSAVEQLTQGISEAAMAALCELNADFENAVKDQDWQQMLFYDREFHRYLLTHSGQRYAHRFSNLLFAQLLRYEQVYFKERFPDGLAAVNDHQRLLKSLAVGKAKKAGKLMRRHWLRQVKALTRMPDESVT